jgi:hypothetical protein
METPYSKIPIQCGYPIGTCKLMYSPIPDHNPAGTKEQTAVQWLIQQLVRLDKDLHPRRKSEDSTVLEFNPDKLYAKAISMEREQIERAYDCAVFGHGINGEPCASGGKYYNETYGKGV